MERIYRIAQVAVGNMPDSFFYYTLCLLLLVTIIWGIKKWLDNNKETFDTHGKLITDMGKCIIELTTITKVHEIHIQSLLKDVEKQGEDLETLREFYIVTYKK